MFGQAVELSPIAAAILDKLLVNRRGIPGETPCSEDCSLCYRTTLERIAALTDYSRPIHFVLPAFPAKSPNRQKVLGDMPDCGEVLALQNLNSLCTAIGHIYSPGAHLTICSDGLIFSDLVGITDTNVLRYHAEIQRIIEQQNLTSLNLFALSDVAQGSSEHQLRQWCLQNFAPSLEEIREQIIEDEPTRDTFNGMARFVLEDLQATVGNTARTRTSLRKEAKSLAYQMMQRSISWGAAVADRFPYAVRLSVHPQSSHSPKFGIQLIATVDNWLTPWHGVVAEVDGVRTLCKRHQIEAAGGQIVYSDGRPSHYVLNTYDLLFDGTGAKCLVARTAAF